MGNLRPVKTYYNHIIIGLIISALSFALFSSCSTDFDVNAPFEETPAAYCIVNPDSGVVFVRLNRGFQNRNGDARDIAKNEKDSIMYKAGDIQIFLEYARLQGTRVVKTIATFKDTIINNKSLTGDFYGPDYRAYKSINRLNLKYDENRTNPEWFNQNVVLKIVIKGSTDTMIGTTNLIGDFEMVEPRLPDPVFDSYRFNPQPGLQATSGVNLQFSQPCWGSSYKVDMILNIREYYTTGDSATIKLTWENIAQIVGNRATCPVTESNRKIGRISNASFFSQLVKDLTPRNNQVTRRRFLVNYMRVVAGSESITRFTDVSNNFNPISQTQPVYSNFSRGLGVIGSNRVKMAPFLMNDATINDMNEPQGLDFKYPELAALKFIKN